MIIITLVASEAEIMLSVKQNIDIVIGWAKANIASSHYQVNAS